MIAILFCKYVDNHDSSQVTMKKFNGSPEGRYPSFTFCILASNGKLFREDILQNDFGLIQEAYYRQLTGERDAKKLELSKGEFDKVAIKIDDFLEEFTAEDSSYQAYNTWTIITINVTGSPFRPSYQDPNTNCVTYDTKYSSSVSLRSVTARFNITKFKHLFIDSGKVRILAHYPG